MVCERLETCKYIESIAKKMPTVAELQRQRLCEGDFTSCARHMVASTIGPEHVPIDLHPTETDRALQIIEEAKAS